ncbi:histidine phosphatase family protein [Paenibacillus sp. N1-5-1-14]|uniref:histidine phosphatase family protein n=1 Tax=Paenibacillus radicibacter TaxID=2972488 RepID=UPI0021593F7A|nr:histidine phosphatase family protein [Paenibacillus radicibacter]MCR8644358.1 histidine phosphatase family protein [Paenibacillus radicibacter]
MQTTIYMVRHAESPFVFGQEKERGLSDEGHADAVRVADKMDSIHVDYVAASTYERTIQTVQQVAVRRSLPIHTYDELRERPIKGLDYKAPWEELLIAIEKSFTDHDYALAGGETTREAQARSIPVLEQIILENKGKSIVLGTHGNIMTIILNYYDASFGYEFWMQTSKPDIYKAVFENGKLIHFDRVWEPSTVNT